MKKPFTVPRALLVYFRSELYKAITFVMVAFVGLFAFFDLIAEVDRLSLPGTSWFYYFVAVLLGLPARVYEIAPIAALIGSIYALVQLAASSELTAMRVIGIELVLDAMIASSRSTLPAASKILRLISSRSVAASMTRSAPSSCA